MAGHEDTFGLIAGIGSILSLIGMLIFAVIVYTRVGLTAPLAGRAEPLGVAD